MLKPTLIGSAAWAALAISKAASAMHARPNGVRTMSSSLGGLGALPMLRFLSSCPGRSAARSGALQTRDRDGTRPRISGASLRATPRPGHKASLLHIPPRERVVVIFLRDVRDLPPHLVHVLQVERADAALLLDRLDPADSVAVLVLLGGGMRRIDLGRRRH